MSVKTNYRVHLFVCESLTLTTNDTDETTITIKTVVVVVGVTLLRFS